MKILAIVLSTLVFAPLAQAGAYTLKCQSQNRGIRLEITDLVNLNQEIPVDSDLVSLRMPVDEGTASVKLFQDFLDATNLFVKGEGRAGSYTLHIKGDRYRFVARNHDETGTMLCQVLAPNGKRVR